MNVRMLRRLIGSLRIGIPLAGLLYQKLASISDAHRYPPPGQLIDVGGHRLHLYTTGKLTGKPSVILEGGLPSTCLDWCKVQPAVASLTQVCSYDRAGFGWSDSSSSPSTCQSIVKDLHTLLTNAGIPAPYILVGHSFGGLTMRLYATTYPQEVAGLVLVDATPEDLYAHQPELERYMQAERRQLKLLQLTAPFGMVRLTLLAGLTPTEQIGYSQDVLPIVKALYAQTRFLQETSTALVTLKEGMAQVRASRSSLDPLPLRVLSQGQEKESGNIQDAEIWQMLQRDLLNLSSNSSQLIAPQSGHYIQLDQPELVIDAITSLL